MAVTLVGRLNGQMTEEDRPWSAVVLSGGRSRRLGGTPKHAVRVGDATLLERTLAAVAGASEIVVVGEAPDAADFPVIREDPPFAGPAAAIGAALGHVRSARVTVTACDHPFVADAIATLMAEQLDDVDGAIAVDASRRRQNLLFTASRAALARAVDAHASLANLSVHELLAGLKLREVNVSERSLLDVDTWDDHAKLEEIHARTE
jgi:molybdopterin-guanine dinucleotide biosynthesis protein A